MGVLMYIVGALETMEKFHSWGSGKVS